MEPIIGQVIHFAGNFVPRGWALCDGRTLTIENHTALYAVIGNKYGGDGEATFALPDFRPQASSFNTHGFIQGGLEKSKDNKSLDHLLPIIAIAGIYPSKNKQKTL